jgi:pantoate--beta-alanine ligase
MPKAPFVATTRDVLRRRVARLRKDGTKIALVPTMGALHDGHLALVREAKRNGRAVVVSIFVNPKQFAPTEDLAAYPRDMTRDLAALAALDTALVWAPDETQMYPEGFSTAIQPAGPALAGLEDAFRPHFFGGVATVVAKLFLQVGPDIALFGEKDYQQLMVVTRMAADLDIPVTVRGCPTIREPDGLAMSSRNVYLSAEERAVAPTLYRVLSHAAEAIRAGRPIDAAVAAGRTTIGDAGFVLDYLEARDAGTLAPVASRADAPIRLLVAARLGRTRLIDNLAV